YHILQRCLRLLLLLRVQGQDLCRQCRHGTVDGRDSKWRRRRWCWWGRGNCWHLCCDVNSSDLRRTSSSLALILGAVSGDVSHLSAAEASPLLTKVIALIVSQLAKRARTDWGQGTHAISVLGRGSAGLGCPRCKRRRPFARVI
ncbi:hypothetical protein BV25DRAFT_1981229, partial [Artomyces pyxidatus]